MTDNEIIKALECCNDNYSCPTDCPLYEDDRDCLLALNKPVLDLINRQKAEIEHLKSATNCYRAYEEEQKAEAVKEFAERLKAKERVTFPLAMVIDVYEVDNLVKEMVGDG